MTDRHEQMMEASVGALDTLRLGLVQILDALAASDALLDTLYVSKHHPVRVANLLALALDNRAPEHAKTARPDMAT